MYRLAHLRSGFRYFLAVLLFAGIILSCNDDDEAPVPEVTSVNPSSAYPNTLISITGKAFSSVFSENKVSFNGKDALVENASSTQLNVRVPADASTGPVTVTVNGKPAANQPVFTVEPLSSVISNVQPLSGGYNTLVTITGSNFNQTAASNTVTFNGVAGVVESATPTSLTVRVPARAGSGMVVVNGVNSNNWFAYVPDVYIVGYVTDNSGIARATYWKNGVPVTLSNTPFNSYANQIAVSGDDIYVSGTQNTAAYGVATLWKNGVEIPLAEKTHASVADGISVVGSDVYVAGYEVIGGKYKATYWKNGTAVTLTDGTTIAIASGIFVNGQDVYVAGNTTHTNGNTVGTYWKNGSPIQLTTGVSFAYGIYVSGSDVYTTGSIRNTGPGVGFVSYWKNTTPTLLGPGLGGGRGVDIVVSGSDVYVAGEEDSVKPVRVAKYWKNGAPVILSDGVTYAVANAIDVLGEDVYVAGVVNNAGGQSTVKLWKNGSVHPITDGGNYSFASGIVLR